MTLIEKLKSILHRDCFNPTVSNNRALIVETQRQSIDLKKKKWKQVAEITELDGDEFFISFDWKNHKTYSPYLIGKKDTLTAKACDYIMFKKEGERWTILLGELKLGKASFSGGSIAAQINGSLAFIAYIKQILKLEFGCNELESANIEKRVIYREKASKCRAPSTTPKRKKGGIARKNIISAFIHFVDTFAHPNNDIVMLGLPFDDDKHSHCTLTLSQFFARS